jgi:hypothetical protein
VAIAHSHDVLRADPREPYAHRRGDACVGVEERGPSIELPGPVIRHLLDAVRVDQLGWGEELVAAGEQHVEPRRTAVIGPAYRLLRAIMNTAVDDKRIGRSPCTVKGAGTTESAKRPIATIAELQAAVDALSPRYRAGFALAA